MGSVMSVMSFAAFSLLPLLCCPFFADRMLLILQTPPLAPPLEGRGGLRIELLSQIVFICLSGFYLFFFRPLRGINSHR